MFIGDKIYNPVSLNSRAIYNVLTDKKKMPPSCIEKWSDDYSCFHTAQKMAVLDNHSVSLGKPNCKHSNTS